MTEPLFEGGRDDADRFLGTQRGLYYVYLLCRPDGRVFYVGKGTKRRALEHEAEARRPHTVGLQNPFKTNVIRKILRQGGAITYRIDSIYAEAEQLRCLEREAELIGLHKRLHEGGILTNLAGGVGNLSGAAPFSLERHAATLSGEPENNPERAVLNRFAQSVGVVKSVYIKPASQLLVRKTHPHSQPRSPSPRCAYALVAAAAANGVVLKPGAIIPRSFRFQDVDGVIENGVASDLVKADMAELIPAIDPGDEAFRLNERQFTALVSLYGREKLTALGLL